MSEEQEPNKIAAINEAANLNCPVCGYYCLGNGGVGCIDKLGMYNLALSKTGREALNTKPVDSELVERIKKARSITNNVANGTVSRHDCEQLQGVHMVLNDCLTALQHTGKQP